MTRPKIVPDISVEILLHFHNDTDHNTCINLIELLDHDTPNGEFITCARFQGESALMKIKSGAHGGPASLKSRSWGFATFLPREDKFEAVCPFFRYLNAL